MVELMHKYTYNCEVACGRIPENGERRKKFTWPRKNLWRNRRKRVIIYLAHVHFPLRILGMSFCLEIALRAWFSFLAALGTTGLGFFVSNIAIFVATLVVTCLVIWAFRGWPRMTSHARENVLIGVVVYCIVFVTVFLPIYCHHLFVNVPAQIRADADRVIAPSINTIPASAPFPTKTPFSVRLTLRIP